MAAMAVMSTARPSQANQSMTTDSIHAGPAFRILSMKASSHSASGHIGEPDERGRHVVKTVCQSRGGRIDNKAGWMS